MLRPTGVANEYQVLYDSGLLTVPALSVPGVSEIATYPVPNIPVQAGDVLAFYGRGIPFDAMVVLTFSVYPVNTAPVQGNLINLGSSAYPIYTSARTYSFAANVS